MKIIMVYFFNLVLMFLLLACSGLEKSEQQKIRKINAKAEEILRYDHEKYYEISFPSKRERDPYSWENTASHKHPKITKEYFRCKGKLQNPVKLSKDQLALFDCQGYDKHSLPIREEKEFIYPVLLDLLNFIQDKTEKKIVITAGHRCYAHQVYLNGTQSNALTKHLIGAEVDFYVQELEMSYEKVVELIKEYYQTYYPLQSEYKFDHSTLDQSGIISWQNKEIVIKVTPKGLLRNEDNQHPYPYLTLEVKYDREIGKKISINFQEALSCYYRW